MLRNFLKSLKGSQTPNKQCLALAYPVPLAEHLKPINSRHQPQFVAWPLKAPPSPAWVATIFGLLAVSYQVAPSKTQAVAELGLWQGPSQEDSEWHAQWLALD